MQERRKSTAGRAGSVLETQAARPRRPGVALPRSYATRAATCLTGATSRRWITLPAERGRARGSLHRRYHARRRQFFVEVIRRVRGVAERP